MADFIKALIYSSEKAANLARAIRAEHDLFSLLVQEKDNGEKNARFVRDFKTLADVLIQETIRYDLTNKVSIQMTNVIFFSFEAELFGVGGGGNNSSFCPTSLLVPRNKSV